MWGMDRYMVIMSFIEKGLIVRGVFYVSYLVFFNGTRGLFIVLVIIVLSKLIVY